MKEEIVEQVQKQVERIVEIEKYEFYSVKL